MKRLFKIQFLLMLLLSTMIFANIGGGIAPTVAPTISVNETLTLTPQYGDTQKYAYYKFTVENDTEAAITYTAPSDERIYFVLHKTSPHKQLITKLTDEGSTKNVQATLSAGEYYFLIKKYGASTQGIPLSISLDDGGEPETTQTWRIYDATPAGASIITANAAQKGTVVKLSGDGTQNGYVLGGWENSAEALNSTKKSIRWSMKYNENFTIFVRVMTKNGGRYLMYSNSPYDYAIDNAYVHKGLGKSVANGTWETIERDLEVDLQTNEPNNSITAINGFYVRGSGVFDTVELGNDTVPPGKEDTIPPVITEVSDQIIYSYSYLTQDYPEVASGATIRIANKIFEGHHTVNADGKAITYGAINVFGDGTQTVIVENCKFLNSNVGVLVMNVKKLIVKKSYFEQVGSGIIANGVKEVDIQYNKIKDFGYYDLNKGVPVPWLGVGEAIGIKNTKNFQSLKIQYNLIDNSVGNPKNRCEYATAGDFINLIALEMDKSKTNDDFIISDNYVVGGGKGNTSSAGGIVYDIKEDDYEDNYVVGTDKLTIANNVLYNTSSYLIGGAGLVGGKIQNNIGYLNQHTDWMLLKSKYSGCVYPPPVRTKMYDYNSASVKDTGFAASLRTGGTATRQSIVTYENNRMYATPYHAVLDGKGGYESGNKDGRYAIADVQSVTDTSTTDAFTLIGDNTFYLNDKGKIVSYEKQFADQYPDKIDLLPTEEEVRNLCFGANNKSLFNHVGNTKDYFIESK